MSNSNPFVHHPSVPYTSSNQDSQTLELWLRESSPLDGSSLGFWLILIHGGAWHDPEIASSFADKAVSMLNASLSINQISGIASLNYRLSPYPEHATNPSQPHDPNRNAIHPDHLQDVTAAIQYLEMRFQLGDRYILLGHSCGGTLAFQVLQHLHKKATFPAPKAVVSLAGIYDLALLRDLDPHAPAVQSFLQAAYGVDETLWRDWSPAMMDYARIWEEGRLVVLATCKEDEYVGTEQREAMSEDLKAWTSEGRAVRTVDVEGRHDDCWKLGVGLKVCIEAALQYLVAASE